MEKDKNHDLLHMLYRYFFEYLHLGRSIIWFQQDLSVYKEIRWVRLTRWIVVLYVSFNCFCYLLLFVIHFYGCRPTFSFWCIVPFFFYLYIILYQSFWYYIVSRVQLKSLVHRYQKQTLRPSVVFIHVKE